MVSFVGQWKTELNDCTLFGPAEHERTFLPPHPTGKNHATAHQSSAIRT
jgi:hypothetical protein